MKEENLTVIEIRLRLLRDIKGLTQKELANILNISRGLVNNWENGYADISLKKLVEFAYYFQVPIDYILGLTTHFDKATYVYKKNLNLQYLGKQIKIIRKMLRLNQTDFSKMVHIERSTYGHYENGKTTMSIIHLKEICNTFGFSADWCIGNTSLCIRREKKVQLNREEYNEFIPLEQNI